MGADADAEPMPSLPPVEQQRNCVHAGGQRRRDFALHQIAGVVNAGALAAAFAQPAPADQHQQHPRAAHRLVDHLVEALAGADVVDVDEHSLGAEFAAQRIADRPGVAGGVVTPIADEDLRRGHGGRAGAGQGLGVSQWAG